MKIMFCFSQGFWREVQNFRHALPLQISPSLMEGIERKLIIFVVGLKLRWKSSISVPRANSSFVRTKQIWADHFRRPPKTRSIRFLCFLREVSRLSTFATCLAFPLE